MRHIPVFHCAGRLPGIVDSMQFEVDSCRNILFDKLPRYTVFRQRNTLLT